MADHALAPASPYGYFLLPAQLRPAPRTSSSMELPRHQPCHRTPIRDRFMQQSFVLTRKDPETPFPAPGPGKSYPAPSLVMPGADRGGYRPCYRLGSSRRGPQGATCPLHHRIRRRGSPRHRSARRRQSPRKWWPHYTPSRSVHRGPHGPNRSHPDRRPWLPHALCRYFRTPPPAHQGTQPYRRPQLPLPPTLIPFLPLFCISSFICLKATTTVIPVPIFGGRSKTLFPSVSPPPPRHPRPTLLLSSRPKAPLISVSSGGWTDFVSPVKQTLPSPPCI